MELSVVVPVYGCRGCLRQLHERLCAAAAQITDDFELVFVDDRSPDGAWQELRELAARDPRVVALRLSRNFGQDAAITAGLSRSRGAWTVVLDCDLEEPPEAIPALYAKAHEGFDLVRGVRRGGERPWLRRALGRVWLRLLLERDGSPDYGTLSILSRPVVDEFLRLRDRDREYRLILDWLGFEAAAIPFDRQPRPAGRSTYTLRRLLQVAAAGTFFRTTALLRAIVFLGLLVAVAGTGLAAYDVYDYLTVRSGPPGYTSLAVLVLLLSGVVLVSVGVVGLYVGRIFEQVKGRPLFVVDTELRGESFAPVSEPVAAPAGAGRPPFLVFGRPEIGEEEIAEVVDSLRSGWIGTGPKVGRFERALEAYLDVPHVRCVSSGTAALALGMRALGIGPGDEVLVPAMTFVASANAVEHVGATPVLVDCEPDTYLVDLDATERAITPRTKALMVVHLAGRPVDLERVNELRDRHSLLVVEDAAHAIGAAWDGRRVGGHGNLAAFSFYATKNLTTGEGGAIATDDPALAEEVERLALHGLSLGAWQRFSDAGFRHYECAAPGFKHNLTDLQASLGIHQLARLDAWIERRAELWERYDARLEGLPLVCPPPPGPRMEHARHLYQVLLAADAGLTRDELLSELHVRGIGTGVHYRAVHLQPYYRDRYGLRTEDFPRAAEISERTLSLPLSPGLSEREQDDVVAALSEALEPGFRRATASSR